MVRRLIICLALLVAPQIAAAAMSKPFGHYVLFLSQTVDRNAGSQLHAKLGILSVSASYDFDRGAQALPNPMEVGSLPVKQFTGTQDAVLSAAQQHIGFYSGQLATNVAAWLKQHGVASAWYAFEQEVLVNLSDGSIGTRYLAWTAYIDNRGRISYPNVRIFDKTPYLLYAIYVSKRVADDLPQSWAYPEAGILRWQKRNMKFEALSPYEQIDTGGAYDEPPINPVDPDWGAKCLGNKTSVIAGHPACPTAFGDLKERIGATGAQFGILDYVRGLAPVYDETADPDVPGDTVLTPRASLRVDRRTLDFAGGCGGAIYRNIGSFGFEVSAQVARYFVGQDGAAMQIANFEGKSQSPTEPFDRTMDLTYQQTQTAGSHVISPIGNPPSLVKVGAIKELQYLAPVEVITPPQQQLFFKRTTTWRYATASAVLAKCNPEENRIYFLAGFYDVNRGTEGDFSRFPYPIPAVFTRGQPGVAYFESREDAQWAPCPGIAIYDGNRSIAFGPTSMMCSFGDQMWQYVIFLVGLKTNSCPAGTTFLPDTVGADERGYGGQLALTGDGGFRGSCWKSPTINGMGSPVCPDGFELIPVRGVDQDGNPYFTYTYTCYQSGHVGRMSISW